MAARRRKCIDGIRLDNITGKWERLSFGYGGKFLCYVVNCFVEFWIITQIELMPYIFIDSFTKRNFIIIAHFGMIIVQLPGVIRKSEPFLNKKDGCLDSD